MFLLMWCFCCWRNIYILIFLGFSCSLFVIIIGCGLCAHCVWGWGWLVGWVSYVRGLFACVCMLSAPCVVCVFVTILHKYTKMLAYACSTLHFHSLSLSLLLSLECSFPFMLLLLCVYSVYCIALLYAAVCIRAVFLLHFLLYFFVCSRPFTGPFISLWYMVTNSKLHFLSLSFSLPLSNAFSL